MKKLTYTQALQAIARTQMVGLPNSNGADMLLCPLCLVTVTVMGNVGLAETWTEGCGLIHGPGCEVPKAQNQLLERGITF